MVTIHNLEIRMDVEGEGDEAVFARYFEKYIKNWNRLREEAEMRRRMLNVERALGDRSEEQL